MTATAIRPTVLIVPRPARTRPPFGALAGRLLATWRAARVEFAVGAASVGAAVAAVLS